MIGAGRDTGSFHMVTQGYINYIKSEKWQRKRQQVFAYYGKRCYACRKRAKVLHVHHIDYSRLGREAVTDLIPLCVPCHKEVTRVYKRNRRRGLRRVTMEFVKMKRNQNGNQGRGRRPAPDNNANNTGGIGSGAEDV